MNFSGSRALSDTWEAIKQRIGPLLGLWAVFFVIQLVVMFVFGGLLGLGSLGGMAAGQGLSSGMVLGLLVLYPVLFYINAARSAALTATASPISRSPFGDALNIGFRSGLTLLGVIVLLVLAYFAIGLAVGLVIGLIGAVAGQTVAALLALLIVLPGVIYLGTRVSLISPVVAVDGVRNPITAISKSWRMTQGAALKMFLVYLLVGIAAIVLFGLLLAPVISSFVAAASTGQPPDIAGMIGSLGFTLILLLLLGIVFTLVIAALVAAIHSQLSSDSGVAIGETFA